MGNNLVSSTQDNPNFRYLDPRWIAIAMLYGRISIQQAQILKNLSKSLGGKETPIAPPIDPNVLAEVDKAYFSSLGTGNNTQQ